MTRALNVDGRPDRPRRIGTRGSAALRPGKAARRTRPQRANIQGGSMRNRKVFVRGSAAALALGMAAASPAWGADPYVLGNLSTFAIYGFGSAFTNQFSPGPITVNGNVGVGSGGDMTLHGSGQTITGMIYYADAIVNGTNFNADGTNWINGQASCNSAATCNT